MFGMGLPELIIIMVIALVVIGPSKLPDLARALGKGMSEFRKATQEIKDSLDVDEDLQDIKKDLVDSVSGLDSPPDVVDTESEDDEKPKYESFDEAIEEYEMNKEERASGGEKQEEASIEEETEKDGK